MLKAIVNEEPVGPSFGWFHPGEMRKAGPGSPADTTSDKDGRSSPRSSPAPVSSSATRLVIASGVHQGRRLRLGPSDRRSSSRHRPRTQFRRTRRRRERPDQRRGVGGVLRDRVDKENVTLTSTDFREALTPSTADPIGPSPRAAGRRAGRPYEGGGSSARGLAAGEVGSLSRGPARRRRQPRVHALHSRQEREGLLAQRSGVGRSSSSSAASLCGPFRQRFVAIDAIQKLIRRQGPIPPRLRPRGRNDRGLADGVERSRSGSSPIQPTGVRRAGRPSAHKACSLLKATMLAVLADEIDDRVNEAHKRCAQPPLRDRRRGEGRLQGRPRPIRLQAGRAGASTRDDPP